jgi:hypothetical protein
MLTYFKAIRPRQGFTVDEPPSSSPHTVELFAQVPLHQQVDNPHAKVAEGRESSNRHAVRSMVRHRQPRPTGSTDPRTARTSRCPQRKTSFEKVKFSSFIVSQYITPRVQSRYANYLHKFSFIHTKMAGCENGEILVFQSSFAGGQVSIRLM